MTYKIKQETVVLIFDRNGKFYKYGFDIEASKSTAEMIRGSYKIVTDESN